MIQLSSRRFFLLWFLLVSTTQSFFHPSSFHRSSASFLVGATDPTDTSSCAAETENSETPIMKRPTAMWFERVFGFTERRQPYATTQSMLLQMQQDSHDAKQFKVAEDQTVQFGTFTTPTVQDLRDECRELLRQVREQQPSSSTDASSSTDSSASIHWSNLQAGVLELHLAAEAEGSIFQAASQFNCLEFPSPTVIPEAGITGYYTDPTQGPACAVACGAGTAHRNYLIPIDVETSQLVTNNETNDESNLQLGQSRHGQLNTLQLVMNKLEDLVATQNGGDTNNKRKRRSSATIGIKVRNGYANGNEETLRKLHPIIQHHQDELVSLMQVGVQADTEVTFPTPSGKYVTQVYASAIPITYSQPSTHAWQPLAEHVVLKGVYEATLLVGLQQQLQQMLDGSSLPPKRIYLTKVGGGVFGNEVSWIYDAMRHAHASVQQLVGDVQVPLEVVIVHYGDVPTSAQRLVDELNGAATSASL